MAFPDLAANLVYTVLCLVPGYVSLETLAHAGDVDVDLTDYETTMWSLLGSGVSLSLTYFLYVVSMGVATGSFVLVRPLDIGWVDLVAAYPVLLLVSVLVGYASAKLHGRTVGAPSGSSPETRS